LYYTKEKQTKGPTAQPGDIVSVYYSLQLLSKPDTLIESNKDAQPFEFVLGKGEVIKGWDEGIALFRKGEKGKLIVPSYLGYGSRQMGKAIPPNSILIFDVEVVDVRKENKIKKE
jgi:FKBP-type peptidyl-prolyl cis-trans isomerase